VDKKRIACSAQTFGYGPISNLFSVARHLKQEFSLVLLLDSQRNQFPASNPEVFDEVIYFNAHDELPDLLEHVAADAVLSSFDYHLILAARKKRLPAFFMDALFWFWKLTTDMNKLEECSQRLLTADNQESARILEQLTPHERIFLSYFLATRSYIQADSGITNRLKRLNEYADARAVGVVVYQETPFYQPAGRHVLATLNGEILPTVSTEQSADYAELVMGLLHDTAQRAFSRYPWIILVNRLVLQALEQRGVIKKYTAINILPSVSQQRMNQLEREAVVVFTPPGLTTIYECASLAVPVIFLPEQSIQYVNAHRIEKNGYPVHSLFFRDTGQFQHDSDPDGLETLYRQIIPYYLKNRHELLPRFLQICQKMEDERYRETIVRQQRSSVLNMVHSFNGVHDICADISSHMQPQLQQVCCS